MLIACACASTASSSLPRSSQTHANPSYESKLGAISIVMGAFFAMTQDDIKSMLAYSTISNIGYIFMGLGLASHFGLVGGAVHIFNHALIKATLFLGAGAIIHRTGLRNLSDLGGVGRTMPITSGAIAIGAISTTSPS